MRLRCAICGKLFDGVPPENICPDCVAEEELAAQDDFGDVDIELTT